MMKRGRPPEHYLIDICQCGSGIRFYFGGSVELVHGDDWTDAPYNDNAGVVYPEFVDCYIETLIPFSWEVTDIAQELGCYRNSQFCRNDFKTENIALIWCIDRNHERDNIYFFMGEKQLSVVEKLKSLGATTQIIKRGE